MKRLAVAVVALAVVTGGVYGQPSTPGTPVPAAGQPKGTPPRRVRPAPAPVNVPFKSLVERGPDGKVIRIDGHLDVIALQRNPLMDEATWEKVRPMVKEWKLDVDQLAIDNIDFIEKLEGGLADKIDLQDANNIRMMTEIIQQLNGAGPLTGFLNFHQMLSQQQAVLNQQIVSEYQKAVMADLMPKQTAQNQEDRVKQANEVNKFIYQLTTRDAIRSYNDQLVGAAKHMGSILPTLGLSKDQQAKVAGPMSRLAKATSEADTRAAMKEVLAPMTLDQKRAALIQARDLNPEPDPLGPFI